MKQWLPEVRHYGPNLPILLVGLKKDLRTKSEGVDALKCISEEEGKLFATENGLADYAECSSFNKEGVDEVILKSARIALGREMGGRQKKCLIM